MSTGSLAMGIGLLRGRGDAAAAAMLARFDCRVRRCGQPDGYGAGVLYLPCGQRRGSCRQEVLADPIAQLVDRCEESRQVDMQALLENVVDAAIAQLRLEQPGAAFGFSRLR